MLSLHRKLYFPKLKYEGKQNFGSWSSKKTTIIYSLDWTNFTGKLMVDWAVKYQPDEIINFTPALPEKWDRWLNGFLFAIPENYQNEIHRCSRLGLIEWSRALPFDTNIREMCMETGETYIKTAFKLISDCAYDSEKNYFYRGEDKYCLKNVMLYKFWSHQTGQGLLWRKAEFHNLEKQIEIFEENENLINIPLYKGLLEDFRKHRVITAYDCLEDNKESLPEVDPAKVSHLHEGTDETKTG